MKKTTYLLAISVFLLVSCGGSSSESNDKNSTTDEKTEISTKSETQNCDDFLEDYEKWTDKSIKLLEAYMKNPMDMELAGKYMALAQEGMDWATKWTNFYGCAAEEKYQKKFDEISERTDKKLKELGLD